MLILHGDNLVASRKFLNEKINQAVASGSEILKLSGEKLTLGTLQQALESKSLFVTTRLVIIENLLSLPPSKTKNRLTNYLRKNFFENLILWEKKEIRSLTGFKKATVRLFKLPTTIFRFLESLTPEGKEHSLSLLHTCLNQDSAEMVFYMLIRQLRLLIIAKDLGVRGLDKMADWQKTRLVRQAQKFRLSQLIVLYRQLLKIDYEQKTGRASMPLSSQLDLLIASL